MIAAAEAKWPASSLVSQAFRPAGDATDQVRAGDQPADGALPRNRRAANAARHRQRGDRVADRRMAGMGQSRRFLLRRSWQPYAYKPSSRNVILGCDGPIAAITPLLS